MAPVRARGPSIERTDEYEKFMDELEAYHAKRGTTFEREPKVGSRRLDLLRLYQKVTAEGGYDHVSDTKGNPLAWRKMASEFLPGSSSIATQAFMVKTAYYRNLAAYEISHFHKKEPPPKEILEDVSAKGGALLSRTLENYPRPGSREANNLANGQDDEDGSDSDVKKTPKEDKMEVDEPGSTGGRVTRSLRHNPPQRALFQNEGAGRSSRGPTANMNSPTPSGQQANGSYGMNGVSQSIASYEPRQPIPSAVKPVVTPANNPEWFRSQRNKLLAMRNQPRSASHKGMMLPGTGFLGPNIYIRALLALQSGVLEEEEYALHHLVKISHERGDKYEFNGFSGLAEALIQKVLDVCSLFYDVRWRVTYDEEESKTDLSTLNGLTGTPNILEKLRSLMPLAVDDDVQTPEFISSLGRINEAGLILRNMVMLESNAKFVSEVPLMRDLIVAVLNLPHRACIVELQLYALEIAEQLTKYWEVPAEDALYTSLLAQLSSDDRGVIIASLRAISRISLLSDINNRLPNVPVSALQSICDWLLVEDEELRNACLDFLYQFTAVTDNVEILVQHIDLEPLATQLVRLLLHNAWSPDPTRSSSSKSSTTGTRPGSSNAVNDQGAPTLSQAIIKTLIALDEPERSSQWLRTCFEEDPQGEITQIQLWTAYQAAFNDALTQAGKGTTENPGPRPLMPAKDFITNVSSTFSGATAQVVTQGGTSKYTIKGIRPRNIAVDSHGRAYMPCQWRVPNVVPGMEKDCGEFAFSPEQMWTHIVEKHMQVPKDSEGKYILTPGYVPSKSIKAEPVDGDGDTSMENITTDNPTTTTNGTTTTHAQPPSQPKTYTCRWGPCIRFHPSSSRGSPSPIIVGKHIQTHLPDSSDQYSLRMNHNRTPEDLALLTTQSRPSSALQYPNGTPAGTIAAKDWKTLYVPTDERGQATGLPLMSALCLRNLARQLPKLEDDDGNDGDGNGERETRVEKLFVPLREQLFYVMAHTVSLKDYLVDLERAVLKGSKKVDLQ